jgi:hypothetical protein
VSIGTPQQIGDQLYRILPAIYRTRDDGTLQALLDIFGGMLDEIRATLDQRLADSFPSLPGDARQTQSWLLPYFAQLVDARLRSPHPAGRDVEVAQALTWRKARGTVKVLQSITEAMTGPSSDVGAFGREVAVQEGFTRVAITARIGIPILPAAALGEPDIPEAALASPGVAARLPGLPAMFVDTRQGSRAVQCPPEHPLAQTLNFATAHPVSWRQLNPRGAPCFPDSFEDRTHRTVDLRAPRDAEGQAEPRRVLLFTAPSLGAFDPRSPLIEAPVNPSVTPPDGAVVAGQRIGTLTVSAGTVTVTGCWIDQLDITGEAQVAVAASAVKALQTSDTPPGGAPFTATDCLLGSVQCDTTATLVYCTVLGATSAAELRASDCIFVGDVTASGGAGCVRFSRLPSPMPSGVSGHANTNAVPLFLELPACAGADPTPQVPDWGEPGCGVLDTATGDAIRFGAEDGGEMGAYHAYALGLEDQGLLDKTTDHMPLGVTPALITDPRLLHLPPAIEVPG